MNKKITLHLDESVIASAKIYAAQNNISLSKLVEDYLKSLVDPKNVEITQLVKSLSGVVELQADFDVQGEYTNYLIEKY
jgi:hypothetical protein